MPWLRNLNEAGSRTTSTRLSDDLSHIARVRSNFSNGANQAVAARFSDPCGAHTNTTALTG